MSTSATLQHIRVPAVACRFVSAMIDAAGWSAPDVLEFLETPWHWDDEFRMWREHGTPTAGNEGFAAFAALIEAAS